MPCLIIISHFTSSMRELLHPRSCMYMQALIVATTNVVTTSKQRPSNEVYTTRLWARATRCFRWKWLKKGGASPLLMLRSRPFGCMINDHISLFLCPFSLVLSPSGLINLRMRITPWFDMVRVIITQGHVQILARGSESQSFVPATERWPSHHATNLSPPSTKTTKESCLPTAEIPSERRGFFST